MATQIKCIVQECNGILLLPTNINELINKVLQY